MFLWMQSEIWGTVPFVWSTLHGTVVFTHTSRDQISVWMCNAAYISKWPAFFERGLHASQIKAAFARQICRVERTKFASAAFTQIHRAAYIIQNIFQPCALVRRLSIVASPESEKEITRNSVSLGVCFPRSGRIQGQVFGSDKSKRIFKTAGVIYYITLSARGVTYALCIREREDWSCRHTLCFAVCWAICSLGNGARGAHGSRCKLRGELWYAQWHIRGWES